ncbi:MAG: cupin [Robiginitomaculum sp.]|nr:MAG: cupin [Robiginitomaculum sp.]
MSESKRVRRVVTGHDEHGDAIFTADDVYGLDMTPTKDAAMTTIWTTDTYPVDNNDETDGRDRESGLTLNGGSVIRICDIYPLQVSPMHRTNSIDYGIVLEGKIELELDNGIKKTVSAGEVIVQRGTMHLWRNPSKTQTCRLAFILIEAKPYSHNGMPLRQDKPEDP